MYRQSAQPKRQQPISTRVSYVNIKLYANNKNDHNNYRVLICVTQQSLIQKQFSENQSTFFFHDQQHYDSELSGVSYL